MKLKIILEQNDMITQINIDKSKNLKDGIQLENKRNNKKGH